MFFFSPYFSTKEKQEASTRLLDGADESFVNFLELLIENHRMPVIFRIRARVRAAVGAGEPLLPVEITSAIELDEATTESLGAAIGERTGRKVTLAARVDPDILGGIVVQGGQLDPRRLNPQSTGAAAQAGCSRSLGAAVDLKENDQCRSTQTRSQASSRAASRDSTPAAPS